MASPRNPLVRRSTLSLTSWASARNASSNEFPSSSTSARSFRTPSAPSSSSGASLLPDLPNSAIAAAVRLAGSSTLPKPSATSSSASDGDLFLTSCAVTPNSFSASAAGPAPLDASARFRLNLVNAPVNSSALDPDSLAAHCQPCRSEVATLSDCACLARTSALSRTSLVKSTILWMANAPTSASPISPSVLLKDSTPASPFFRPESSTSVPKIANISRSAPDISSFFVLQRGACFRHAPLLPAHPLCPNPYETWLGPAGCRRSQAREACTAAARARSVSICTNRDLLGSRPLRCRLRLGGACRAAQFG